MSKINPKPKHYFPSRITIELPDFQRNDLESLYRLHQSHDTEQEFFKLVVAYGILSMLDEQSEARAGKREASARPFPAVSVRFKRMRDKQLADLDQGDVGLADVRQEDDGPLDFPKRLELALTERQQHDLRDLADRLPHRNDLELASDVLSRGIAVVQEESARDLTRQRGPVENYVGIPLESRIRTKLEDFLRAFPGAMPEEEIYALLLDLGMDQAKAMRLSSRSCRTKP